MKSVIGSLKLDGVWEWRVEFRSEMKEEGSTEETGGENQPCTLVREWQQGWLVLDDFASAQSERENENECGCVMQWLMWMKTCNPDT